MIKRHARMVAVAIAATIGFALVDAPAAMAQASAAVPTNPPAAKPLSKANARRRARPHGKNVMQICARSRKTAIG